MYKTYKSPSLTQRLAVMVLIGVFCLGFAAPVYSQIDQEPTWTAPAEPDGIGPDDPPDMDGYPTEDSATADNEPALEIDMIEMALVLERLPVIRFQ